VHTVVTALIVFVAIFLAELPDKTALASLILGARYRASLVWAGVAAAFTVHVALAIAAGSLLRLLPHRPLQIVVAVLFAVGAVLLLREGGEDEEETDAPPEGLSPWRVVATSFTVILVAEFGDLTQILTANLAARYHDPVAVAIGAVLALWSVGALAIVGGKALLARISLRLITRLAAAIMLVLAVFSAVSAVRG
jgi:putative Ca2+/H+ antiporter (TMEM165/GDT1 family)